MNKETLEKFKGLLEQNKMDLEKELARTPETVDMGSDTEGNEDFSEEAHETEEATNNIAIRNTLKERLYAINNGLKKIADGSYGQCEKCDGDIDEKILTIDSESSLCKNCKIK